MEMLEFLRNEKEKVEKVLRKESGNNYKKYATLLQAYLTEANTVNQLEAFEKQKKEAEKKAEEERKAWEQAEKEAKEEEENKKIK